MAKKKIKEIKPYVTLFRDNRTGIAWVENGNTGNEHSAHPNIDRSGSVRGMKRLGYWDTDDRVVQCNGSKYNVSKVVVTDELDEIAKQYCRCEGCV
ncbi:hypothetical protein IMZ31_22175 (plasmid) [Pontibacillus sp. ALD_SL1]|uniref:hypothetical protein n=1 Tax=Pontibacillus sp. ALD_SL1 TaxID=2777185 RepID=UPI001A956B5B|nr:hypothetical protein [Pontibacillus sp. ALD_SL1]QST02162.1 hypothetical protein IMZ31_22175 [Pontibacillus sp. ALD_SL1]